MLALILAVIGVSYAFFSLQVNGEGTTTKIEISTGEAGGITLSGKVENFHISVNATDMAYKNLGDYYATDNQDKHYADSKEDGTKDLGRIDISGTLSETNSCSATIKLEFTTSILEKIQEGDFTLGLLYGEEEQEIDLTNIPSEGTTIEFELDGTINPSYIRAYLKLNNADRDQSYLANQEMKVKVSIDSFVCEEGAKGLPPLEMLDLQGGTYYGGGKQGSRTAVEGLYRFKGTYSEVKNNYICLGADENPDKCKTNANNMYRIIGVTDGTEESTLGLKAGMLKVIKATPSNTGQAWSTNSSSNIDWDNGSNTVRTYLNSTFYNGNTIDSRIKPYIAEVNWWKGDRTNATSSGEERKTKTSGKYRVGLMYASDYYNSWSYDSNTNSWLHIIHGTSNSSTYSSTYEWTMTRSGTDGYGYEAWGVRSDGPLNRFGVAYTYASAVRPVFYLSSDVKLTGQGIETDPFIIG